MSVVERYIDPRVTALLAIDMQNGFCHIDSRMEKAGIGTVHQRAIVPSVLRLIDLAHTRKIPVLFSKQVHFPEDTARARHRIPSHQTKQKWTPCVRGTWEVDLIEEVAAVVRPDDYIVEKHRASMFFQTTLDAKLRMLGIEQILVSGTTTAFCVETTIRDAYFRDFDVIAIKDCIADPRPQFHEDTMAKVEQFFGAVVTLDELPSLMIETEEGAAARPILADVAAEGVE